MSFFLFLFTLYVFIANRSPQLRSKHSQTSANGLLLSMAGPFWYWRVLLETDSSLILSLVTFVSWLSLIPSPSSNSLVLACEVSMMSDSLYRDVSYLFSCFLNPFFRPRAHQRGLYRDHLKNLVWSFRLWKCKEIMGVEGPYGSHSSARWRLCA